MRLKLEFRMKLSDCKWKWSEWKYNREYKTEKALLAGLAELNKREGFEYRRMK